MKISFFNLFFVFTFAVLVSVLIVNIVIATGTAVSFSRNLKIGDFGADVMALQKLLNSDSDTSVALSGPGSKGSETTYFGPATRLAVIKFQNKYKSEVLYPAGVVSGTGYVGSYTIAKLNRLSVVGTYVAGNNSPVFLPPSGGTFAATTSATTTQVVIKPKVLLVSPDRVKGGDTVTITGQNFTATGNSVILGDGPVEQRFDNLSSSDGKTITFVYKPPTVQTMTKEQVESLPENALANVKKSLAAVGATLDDALTPYKGIHNEAELKAMLEKNGRSFNEMYHYFWVTVANANGSGRSKGALLWGLRKFPFDETALDSGLRAFSDLGQSLVSLLEKIFPAAHAQYGGGFTTGIIMVCSCSGGELAFNSDFSIGGAGSGFYWLYPGFVPQAGTGMAPGFWLGGYLPEAGFCWIGVEPFCVEWPSNLPIPPIGYSD